MRSTPTSEAAEIIAAKIDLQLARREFEIAHDAAAGSRAPILSALADKEDEQWVRVALAERREKAALAARAAGDARRGRSARWRRLFGRRTDGAAAPESPSVHAATVTFLDASGDHDSGEDVHPSRLDPVEADLDDALAREHGGGTHG